MENVVYLELKARGFSVDVGQTSVNEKSEGGWKRKNCEIDFIASKGSSKTYIQCAFAMPDAEKRHQEERPLINVEDSFEKMIIVRDNIHAWRDDHGVLTIGLLEFLMDPQAI